jgi:hypothetical protein
VAYGVIEMFALVKAGTMILTLFVACMATKLPIYKTAAASHLLHSTMAHDTAT